MFTISHQPFSSDVILRQLLCVLSVFHLENTDDSFLMILLGEFSKAVTFSLSQGALILSLLVNSLPVKSCYLLKISTISTMWMISKYLSLHLTLFLASALYWKCLYYTPTWISHQEFQLNVSKQTTHFALLSNFDPIPSFSASVNVIQSSLAISRFTYWGFTASWVFRNIYI